jgi:molybdopterin/thiamine biosynthesis adenylyltransferase
MASNLPQHEELNNTPATAATIRLDVRSGPPRTSLTDPPPPEIAGDVFDRQRVMVNWNQQAVETTRALILGTGGLGSSVAMGLARMGVEQITLLDFDVVDASNLNRQILFNKTDVGQRKVDAAKRALEAHFNLRSKINTIHTDGVRNWKTVVDAAKESTVIFNCIDYGATYDYAVNSLCKFLAIPYVSGSSYANTMLINYFSGKEDEACWSCLNSTDESFFWTNATTEVETWQKTLGVELLTSDLLEKLLEQKLEIRKVEGLELVKQSLEEAVGTNHDHGHEASEGGGGGSASTKIGIHAKDYKTFVKKYFQPKVLRELAPDRITRHVDLSFIPKDENFPTRLVGSWICVCTGAALMMVNAWAQGLAGVSFPNFNNFTLSTFHASNSMEDGADGKSDSFCSVCKIAKEMKTKTK